MGKGCGGKNITKDGGVGVQSTSKSPCMPQSIKEIGLLPKTSASKPHAGVCHAAFLGGREWFPNNEYAILTNRAVGISSSARAAASYLPTENKR